MSCDDLDRLRTGAPHRSSSGWPPEARRHLESCERCRRLQAVLDNSLQMDFPEVLRDNIEGVILCDLRPVSPLPGAMPVAITLLLFSVVVIAAANWRLGIAGWRARSGLQAFVDFGLLSLSVVVLANTLAHQMAPGSNRRAAVSMYPGLSLLALLTADVVLFGYRWNPAFVPLALNVTGAGPLPLHV